MVVRSRQILVDLSINLHLMPEEVYLLHVPETHAKKPHDHFI